MKEVKKAGKTTSKDQCRIKIITSINLRTNIRKISAHH